MRYVVQRENGAVPAFKVLAGVAVKPLVNDPGQIVCGRSDLEGQAVSGLQGIDEHAVHRARAEVVVDTEIEPEVVLRPEAVADKAVDIR